MKRLSKEARQKLLMQLRSLLRRRKRKQRASRAKARLAYLRKRRDSGKPRSLPSHRIAAPQIFSLEANEYRKPLLQFLAQLRTLFHDPQSSHILIDFTRTHRFVATGTLLFYAELTRLIELTGGRIRVRCTAAANPRATQVLQQIGVFQICGHKNHGTTTFDDVVHWRVARGHLVDNTICATAIEAFEGKLAEPLLDGIFRGLGEAMTNAKHHAYTGIREDGLNFVQPQDDWWMFSQARDGKLSVVFCDLGVGIPTTLPIKKPTIFARLLALGRASSDAACIEEAIEESRTSTDLPGRGHGLGNIVNVVSQNRSGLVVVMSNRGFYIIRDGNVTATDFRDSILGTLIFWRVPLDGAAHGET